MASFTFVHLTILIILMFCYAIRLASATIYIKPDSFFFPDSPARFAPRIKSPGICGALYKANPRDGCVSLNNRLKFNEYDSNRFVLIVRGNCSFEDKVRNAQNAGFDAAIIYNDRDKNNLVSMIGNSDGIFIYAVFTSQAAGDFLMIHATEEEGQCCIYPSVHDKAWNVLIISLFSIITIVFVLTVLYFCRYFHLYRRSLNHHHSATIDAKLVKNLTSFVFNSARANSCAAGETCAICLDDYKDGDNLRVLPCQHEFHASCVDPWLTNWSIFCPVCKHKLDPENPVSKVASSSR